MLKKLIFIFSIFCCLAPAWGLTLKVMRPGDSTPLEIALHATKRTEHALALKTADGTIYYADMRPVGRSFPGGLFTRIDSQIYQVGVEPSTFSITTTSDTDNFSFTMTAKGTFMVDWGDGAVQEIVRTDTAAVTYSHTYSTAGTYIIGFDGRATGYNSAAAVPAISFMNNQNVGGINGSLGAIFSTIGDGNGVGQQPQFHQLFFGCSKLTGLIPENFFDGVHGQPVQYMFTGTFESCGLMGPIPANLFAGIKGWPASFMFFATFKNSAFTGPIPENLFAGISGAPASYMFWNTFQNCRGLTSVPENLFGNISGSLVTYAFSGTFAGCTGLRGYSAKINGKYLYEIWPDATTDHVVTCYNGDTGLSDYANIPDAWK